MLLEQKFSQIFKIAFNSFQENFRYGTQYLYGGHAYSSLLCNGINKGHNDEAQEYGRQQDRFRTIMCLTAVWLVYPKEKKRTHSIKMIDSNVS